MPLDINALRAKLKGMEEGKPKSKKWKPKDEHIVRCLPLPGDPDDIALVLKWHYGMADGRQMYCPTTHGESCPFCDFAQTLRGWKDDDGNDKTDAARKADWEWFKKLDAAVKHYIPVIVRKEKDGEYEGPYLWELTPKTHTSVFKVVCDDERNDGHPAGGGLAILTSLEHGVDLKVELKKAGQKGNTTSYDLTEATARTKMTPVLKGVDKAAIKKMMDSIPTLADIGTPISTAEANIHFKKWESTFDKDAVSADAGLEVGGEKAAANSSEEVATGGLKTDDVISKLEALMAKKPAKETAAE
jgi:hypothetical protein